MESIVIQAISMTLSMEDNTDIETDYQTLKASLLEKDSSLITPLKALEKEPFSTEHRAELEQAVEMSGANTADELNKVAQALVSKIQRQTADLDVSGGGTVNKQARIIVHSRKKRPY